MFDGEVFEIFEDMNNVLYDQPLDPFSWLKDFYQIKIQGYFYKKQEQKTFTETKINVVHHLKSKLFSQNYS